MKILSKIILTLLLTVTMVLATSSNSIAMKTWEEMKRQGDSFIQTGQNQGGDTLIDEQSLADFALPIARALVAIATGVLVVVTVIIGIQYSMANPADKAKLKQKLIGLAVSTIVIFGAQGIWALAYNFMTEVTK